MGGVVVVVVVVVIFSVFHDIVSLSNFSAGESILLYSCQYCDLEYNCFTFEKIIFLPVGEGEGRLFRKRIEPKL